MLVLLLAWAGGVPGAVDAATVSELVTDEQQFLSAGGDVLVVDNEPTGANPGGVPASACVSLADAEPVHATAALTRLRDPATPTSARGGDIATFAASGDLWGLLGMRDSPARDGILTASIAERLGVADGQWLALEPSPGTLGERLPPTPIRVTVADTEPLGEAFTGLLLPTTVAADPVADTCVVRAEPAALDTLRSTLPGLLARGPEPARAQDRLFTGEFTADPSAALAQRPTQWAWTATGILIGLVWLLIRWVRRSDDALYATMGADALDRLLIRGTEWVLLAALGSAWGLTGGVVLAMALDVPYTLALPYVFRHVAASFLLATAVVLLGQVRRSRSLLADLKDR